MRPVAEGRRQTVCRVHSVSQPQQRPTVNVHLGCQHAPHTKSPTPRYCLTGASDRTTAVRRRTVNPLLTRRRSVTLFIVDEKQDYRDAGLDVGHSRGPWFPDVVYEDPKDSKWKIDEMGYRSLA